ncbi:MAG: hypothetical protein KAJ66_06325 [Candidatus Omnitrophica bacterium]|nr:hypothetical protein [Candidatus Omnitrophota bacterium]
MKKYLFIFITVLILTSQASSVFSSEKELSEEQLLAIYHQRLKDLNLPQMYEGLKEEDFDADLKVVYKIDENRYNKRVAIIGKSINSKYRMELDPTTGQILHFYSKILNEKINKDNILYKKGEQPNRDKQEIIKEAEEYAKIMNNGSIPEGYFFDNAHFAITFSLNSKLDYDGYWSIMWRKKIDGYKTWADAISVCINERYGIIRYSFPTPFKYISPKKINISSKEEAIKLARKLGAELINNKSFRYYNRFRGYKIGKFVSADMVITTRSCIDGKITFCPQPVGRLLWAVSFRAEEIEPREGDASFPVGFHIDVETGELVGFR